MKRVIGFFDSHGKVKKLTKAAVDFLLSTAVFIVLCILMQAFFAQYGSITKIMPQVVAFGAVQSLLLIISWTVVGKYTFMWKGSEVRETNRVLCATGVTFIILAVVTNLIQKRVSFFIPGETVIFISLVADYIVARCVTLFLKWIRRRTSSSGNVAEENKRTMIVGAGWVGTYTISQMHSGEKSGRPVIIVDDDPVKRGQRLMGVPIKGNSEDIPELAEKYDIEEIIIAIPSLQGNRLSELVNICKKTDCKLSISQHINAEAGDTKSKIGFREINISDFLSRDEVSLNSEAVSRYISGKRILVTGGGGSIGSELCRQILKFLPEKVIVFDIYENSAYELQQELIRLYGKNVPLKVLIGSVRDKRRLDEVFEKEKPQIVFHAAAHKHVPLMEDSPAEAIKNNVLGTFNTMLSASEHNAERFVMISTDKAVNPTNVMGATKRMCEMIMQGFSGRTKTKCVAVRFGNVLGSHGSVIPLFEKQIKSGGPVTVTHPDIIRYFMTIPEAAQLVLQAGTSDKSGEIYVLDMGKPMKIKTLAEDLIRFFGHRPDVDIKIEYTGLRPGEKLYEELLMDEEEGLMQKTQHDKIFVASPLKFDEKNLFEQIEKLRKCAEHNDDECIRVLASVVSTFHPDYERNNLIKD